MRQVAAIAVLACAASGAADALQCGEGGIHASPSASAPPDDNVQCIVLGRMFCMAEEARASGNPPQTAIDRMAGATCDAVASESGGESTDKRPAMLAVGLVDDARLELATPAV